MSKLTPYSFLNDPLFIEPNYANAQRLLQKDLIAGAQMGLQVEKEKVSAVMLDAKGYEVSADSYDDNSTNASFVARLSIKQPIVKYGSWWLTGSKDFMRILDSLKGDDSVAGVILDIDSGGGQVYGTPEFHEYLRGYNKPIVTFTDGLMCSAAYYLGAGTNYIIAHNRADDIGSIGTYTTIYDWNSLDEHYGLPVHEIYAPQSKEKNKAYRDVIEGKYDTYKKEVLGPITDTFIADMKASRPNIDESVFKGATYNAEKSLELGLIDAIGTLSDAVDKVFELHNNQGDTNSQTTTNKLNIMSKYNKIATLLGVDELATDENGAAHLTADFLAAIEASIEGNEEAITTAVEKAKKEAATANTEAVTTAVDAEKNATTTALAAVCKEAGVEAGEDNAATITALGNKIAELGAADGGTTTTEGKEDKVEGGDAAPVSSWMKKAQEQASELK